MVWIETAQMQTWGCSECGWTFTPSGPPIGNTMDEMMQNFERQRDRECGLHVCAANARRANDTNNSRASVNLPIDSVTRPQGIGINAKA
jgi:hypothetical protein